ncbi:hypothetical protein os4_34180 [Comamonadaceae bacterium OS-4]|nr:hypothetical protein os4_34180 [Comamonadaceae bacterium OS-4]
MQVIARSRANFRCPRYMMRLPRNQRHIHWQASTSPISSRPSISGVRASLRQMVCRCRTPPVPWLRFTHCLSTTTRQRRTSSACLKKRSRLGKLGTRQRPTRRVLRFAPPAKAMNYAKAAGVPLKKCSFGRKWAPPRSVPPGGASPWMLRRGDLTAMPSEQRNRAPRRICYKNNSFSRNAHKGFDRIWLENLRYFHRMGSISTVLLPSPNMSTPS